MALTIRKPDETDPDYLTDGSGHYLLAIHDRLKGLTGEAKADAWKYIQTPLGGYRPLPQARKFHRSAKQFRFCLGGNRASKSHALAVETVWRATGRHPFRKVKVPSLGWYATTSSEKVADTLWHKLDPAKNGLLAGIDHEVVWRSRQWGIPGRVLIPVKGGVSEITFKAYEQGRESFQAVDLDYCHYDEQFGEDIFVESISRIGPGRRLDFAASFTPLIPQQWMEKRTVTDRAASDDVFHFALDDNRLGWGGFIDDEKIDALILNWAPEVRETRRRGLWGAFAGAIFQTFARDVHVVSEEAERRLFFKGLDRVPPLLSAVGSIDWGGNNPFVFLWLTRIPWLDNDWYCFDEYFWDVKSRGPRLLEQHADEIKSRTLRWQTSLERTWADHDPTDVREFYNYGVPSVPAIKDRDSGIETLQTLFAPQAHLMHPADWPKGRPRLHIAARCENLIRELPLYRWKPGTDRADAKREPMKVDDHCVDALRYAAEGERLYEIPEVQDDPSLAGRYKRAF